MAVSYMRDNVLYEQTPLILIHCFKKKKEDTNLKSLLAGNKISQQMSTTI